jgi:hypothetical protein
MPAMRLQVRCRCDVLRTIDTTQVGPWRLRCKQCGDILYDPRASAAEPVPLPFPDPTRPPPPVATDTKRSGYAPVPKLDEDHDPLSDTEFQRRLMDSAELKVMMSSDGEESRPCPRHPQRPIVAACTNCSEFLCKRCLDKVGDAFVCAECAPELLTGPPKPGVMGWLKRLFGGR